MAKHLVPCTCGRTLAADAAQAGETLHCECGALVAVPTLRQLRQMPIARDEHATSARVRPAWGAAQGVAAVCLIVAALSLVVAGYLWLTEPTLPTFDAPANIQLVGRRIDQLTPVEAWRRWIGVYQPLAANGFTAFEHPAAGAITAAIGSRRLLESALVGVAVICLLAAGGLSLSAKSAVPRESR